MEEAPTDKPLARKRKRAPPAPNLQVTECVREFKLTQAYPSMAKSMKKSPVNVTVERVRVPQPTISLKINSGKIDPANKMQKLKLKAPDGRDLGEFDVQVLPPTVPAAETKKGPTISSIKYLGKPGQQVRPADPAATHGVLIPISPMVLNGPNVNYAEQVSLMDEASNNSKVYMVQGNAVHQMNKPNGVPINVNNIQGLQTMNLKGARTVPSGMKIKVINGHSVRTPSGTRLIVKDKVLTSKRRSSEAVVNSRLDPKVIRRDSLDTPNTPKAFYVLPDSDPLKVSPSGLTRAQENEDVDRARNPRSSLGRVNLLRREKRDSSTSIMTNGSTRSECDSTISPTVSRESPEECFTDIGAGSGPEEDLQDLSALGDALRALPDGDLRRRALEALRSVGIGAERLVPKKKIQHISIKDSDTQTEVFGLLDKEKNEFIKASEDFPDLERLSLKERPIGDPERTKRPEHATRQVFNEEDLDSMLRNLGEDEKVKKVRHLMKFDPATERVFSVLEKDFSTVKEYDENGFLNIHRAVLEEAVSRVKRLLMIMKACKISVDVPTKDGQTSLELGIRFAVSDEIIRLLLRAGANPTSSKKAHDSALTIASHRALPILPLLIKHAPTSGDLNYVDSNGFAAIHYCAQGGNYDAVMALIAADVDLNIRDLKSGRTALFHAIENEELKIAQELLMNNARPNLPTFSGQTCYHLFDETKHVSLKDYLAKGTK